MKKECIAMLLAGGQGSRLYVLTGNVAKPAVPFGGKYRIIDFPLSNCSNAGIDTVFVLSGEGTMADIDTYQIHPTWVYPDIGTLYRELEETV